MAWIAIFSCGIFLFFLHRWNQKRPTSLPQLELKPNCLLTRHPFLFVGGKESLFYHGNYWNALPDYLTQHGYEAYTFKLPTRHAKLRQQELELTFQALEKEQKKFHVVIDSSSLHDVQELLKISDYGSIASITHLHSQLYRTTSSGDSGLKCLRVPIEELTVQANQRTPIPWKLHQFFIQDTDKKPLSLFLSDFQHQDHQQIRAKILERAIELAERDFAQTERQRHERPQERSN